MDNEGPHHNVTSPPPPPQPLTARDIKLIKQQQKLLQKLQRKLDKEAAQRRRQEEKKRKREEARKGKKAKKEKYQVSSRLTSRGAQVPWRPSCTVCTSENEATSLILTCDWQPQLSECAISLAESTVLWVSAG